MYEFFKTQGATIVNDAADFVGTNGCYMYRGRDVDERKYSTFKGHIFVIAPQLEMTGIFRMEKGGVQKVLLADMEGRELFEKEKPFLVSLVQKTIYIGIRQKLGVRRTEFLSR